MNSISGFQSGLAGIQNGMNGLRQDAQVIASQGTTNSPTDQNITAAIVDLNVSSHQVEASAKVIATQDQMIGSLLDELA